MLESISWTDFALCLGGGGIAYYGILIATGKIVLKKPAGPAGLSNSNPRKRKWKPEEQPETEEEEDAAAGAADNRLLPADEPAEDPAFTALELLADEVQVIITQSSTESISKETLLMRLRQEIARYPALHKPAFQGAITNVIIKAALQEMNLVITRHEASDLWNQL